MNTEKQTVEMAHGLFYIFNNNVKKIFYNINSILQIWVKTEE